uniref:Uncharacterized protein n=1 Tax=Caenorhabditis japonica TaxID=281687 RepID=A0A8R1IBC2_CAEJA
MSKVLPGMLRKFWTELSIFGPKFSENVMSGSVFHILLKVLEAFSPLSHNFLSLLMFFYYIVRIYPIETAKNGKRDLTFAKSLSKTRN